MSEDVVRLDIDGSIATITLNRPESLNAFSGELFQGLDRAVKEIAANDEVRVAILTGAGDRAFSAGLDLKALAAGNVFDYAKGGNGMIGMISRLKNVFNDVENLPIPVIASIQGYCLGAGLQVALACDIRLAAEDVKFAVLETKLGIVADLGGTQRLPRIVGQGKAREMIYTSRTIGAAEALRIGLVEHVYSKERLSEETLTLAREIAEKAPHAVRGAKRAIAATTALTLEAGLRFETEVAAGTINPEAFAQRGVEFSSRSGKS